MTTFQGLLNLNGGGTDTVNIGDQNATSSQTGDTLTPTQLSGWA